MSPSSWRARASRSLVASIALVVSGCASPPSSESAPRPPERSSSVLTWREIEAAQLGSGLVLDAIRQLRPGFLNPRGGADRGGDQADIQVSINEGIPTALSALQDLSAKSVASVTLMTPGDALLRFGMRESLGPVLLVRLK